MKIRNGFISNSSSTSFLIKKENANKEKLEYIANYLNDIHQDYWICKYNEQGLKCFTHMNNFDVIPTLKKIGIKEVEITRKYGTPITIQFGKEDFIE